MRLLESGEEASRIAAHLHHEIESHFGLDPSYYDFDSVAMKIRTWFERDWKDSKMWLRRSGC